MYWWPYVIIESLEKNIFRTNLFCRSNELQQNICLGTDIVCHDMCGQREQEISPQELLKPAGP